MKLSMPNRSVTENGETDSLIGDTAALDSVVNTKYKEKKKKKKHKQKKVLENGQSIDDHESLGLPAMDNPLAGKYIQAGLFSRSICS